LPGIAILTIHFAYVDESGTKGHQEVMTVALIVVEGRFTANKIQQEILSNLTSHGNKANRSSEPKQQALHYTDMSMERRLATGLVLASRQIDCFIGCYYHENTESPHSSRFAIYTKLLIHCLSAALESHQDLVVSVAQQGGWTGYRDQLVKDLQNAVKETSSRRGFRRAKFELHSAAKPGIQIADFYAGVTRDYLMKCNNQSARTAYDLIEHQVREIRIHTPKSTRKNKE
jgi:hypothetical protein